MGKLYDRLTAQSMSKEFGKEARECIKIYNKLKEINNGSVWDSQWNILVDKVFTLKQMYYRPSKVGQTFLRGV